jgi:hypothetical protein
VVIAIGLLAAACAAPSPSATASPTAVPSPVVSCGDLPVADCSDAAAAALATAAAHGTPVRVEVGRGVFCSDPDRLFGMTTCLQLPPAGGRWVGHAVVTFAESPAQAYMNIVQSGRRVGADFIALATPQPSASSY